jgi:hypothetical protein
VMLLGEPYVYLQTDLTDFLGRPFEKDIPSQFLDELASLYTISTYLEVEFFQK